MNTKIQHAQAIADSDGIIRVQDPNLHPPKGYKQLCIQCRFDQFSTAFHYCPQCGCSALSHGVYVKSETNTPAHTNTKPNIELLRLVDQVDEMTTKTTSILKVMSGFFAECQGTLYDRDAIYYTTQAVIEEVKKIDSAVYAYAESQK